MRPNVRRPGLAYFAVGIASLALGYAMGGGLADGIGTSPGSYIVYVGLFAILLAGSTAGVTRTSLSSDRQAAVAGLVAFLALYLVAVGLLWVDTHLFQTEQTSYVPPLAVIAVVRLAFVLPLASLVSGYVLGAYAGSSRAGGSAALVPLFALVFALLGPALGYVLRVSTLGGGHPGFIALQYALLTFGGVVAAALMYVIAWRGSVTEFEAGRSTGEA